MTETKFRTLKITLEVQVAALPDDEIAELDEIAGNLGIPETDGDVLMEAEAIDVAECIEGATLHPEIFAGSMLYLKINSTKVVSAEWDDAA